VIGAPNWFREAVTAEAERGDVVVDGASIAWSAWGARSKPGLLLLIGNGAHSGWWRPLAPILAHDYRVATFDWSGMGASDWRERYHVETFFAETLEVASATGLFDDNRKPSLAAHSFGGFVGMQLMAAYGERFAGGIIVDSRIRLKSTWGPQAVPGKPFRIHPTKEEAMSRFRLIPEQPISNQYYFDFLAQEAVAQEGKGWHFRQDPDFRRKTNVNRDIGSTIAQAKCPIAFIRGALSGSVDDEMWLEIQQLAGPEIPFVELAEAYHHVMIDQPLALVDSIRELLRSF